MFTGIIEQTGTVATIIEKGSNRTFWISSDLTSELKEDQSLSHNGVCLTVEEVSGNNYRVTAIDETLQKTNLGAWVSGTIINLERCLQMNGRLDGHIVQGHVDTVAVCISTLEKEGSWEFTFQMDKKFAGLIIDKGSISLNGISLTIFNITENTFTVAVIPYTFEHTNMPAVKAGSVVNVEFDTIGKYVNRLMQLQKN